MIEEIKDDSGSVSLPFGKQTVVCRFEDAMSKLGEAHNLLAKTKLPTEEYQPISSLMATAKVELFNIYNEIKNETKDILTRKD